MEPLLEKERKVCKKVSTALDRAERDLKKFQLLWLPAYGRWYEKNFGEEARRLQELESKAAQLEELIDAVEIKAALSEWSEEETLIHLEIVRKKEERVAAFICRLQDETPDPAYEADDFLHASSTWATLPSEIQSYLKSEFGYLFGFPRLSREQLEQRFAAFKQEYREEVRKQAERAQAQNEKEREEEAQAHSRDFEPTRPRGPQNTADALRRKQIYRSLARKLHPDLNAGLSAEEKDIWHQVQEAYDSENLGQLEALAERVENGDGLSYLTVRSVSRLQMMIKEFQKQLRTAQQSIRRAKKQVFWNFEELEKNPTRLKTLQTKIERNLRKTTEALENEIARQERQIEIWRSTPTLR